MPYLKLRDQVSIYYEEVGSGPPLLMVHGWSCNLNFFKYQIPFMAKTHRVIAIDLRGHGRSDRGDATEYHETLKTLGADINDILNGLGADHAALVGWSMGCSVLYDYIRQFGCGQISKLALIDMSPKTSNDAEWTYGMGRTETHSDVVAWASLCADDWQNAAEIFIPGLFANGQPQDHGLMEWAIEQAKDNVPHNLIALLLSMAMNDYRDVLPAISVPTLLVHGEHSTMFGKEHGEYLVTQIKGSRLEVIPDAGHILFMEQPDVFNKVLLDFLQE